MSELMVGSSTAQWQTLVSEAEAACHVRLGEDLQSYLVFLLMRFARRPDMAATVLALDYLRSHFLSGRMRRDQLQDVGDQCLLYSGLFPKRAERRLVKISYYVELGRSAYTQLAAVDDIQGAVYRLVAQTFVPMMDVLQTIRTQGNSAPLLAPLQALELWQDTGSTRALSDFKKVSQNTPQRYIYINQRKH